MSQTPKHDDNPCRPSHFKPVLCAPAPTDGPGRTALEICHTRLIVAGALFVLAFLLIGAPARRRDGAEIAADKTQARNNARRRARRAGRADIVDRNGVLLATTLEMPSLYANPKQIADKGRVAQRAGADLPGADRRRSWSKPSTSPISASSGSSTI